MDGEWEGEQTTESEYLISWCTIFQCNKNNTVRLVLKISQRLNKFINICVKDIYIHGMQEIAFYLSQISLEVGLLSTDSSSWSFAKSRKICSSEL